MTFAHCRRELRSPLGRCLLHLPVLAAVGVGMVQSSPAFALPAAQSTPTFADVPTDHPYYHEIEALYQAGYTAGCSSNPLRYCPDATMNRAESAVFVERGIHSATNDPATPSSQVFADLPLDSWAAKWVNGLWEDQYTAGCGTNPMRYCPWQGHTRAEGAVFYVRMLHGANYEPPPSRGLFADVQPDAWYSAWVEDAYRAHLIEPCGVGPLRYCPIDPLIRAVAAYMMVQAKGLLNPVPTPPTPPPAGSSWVQVWGDEFEGASVDESKWRINEYKRSSDLNKTWYRPENVTVANGVLRLEVKNQSYCDPSDPSDCANFTGGMLDSYDATSKATGYRRLFQYGYFEARIRYHLIGPGFWANFWMWGPPFPPEFDHEVLSSYDGEPNPSTVYAAYHYNSATETDLDASTFYAVSYNDQWHTYGYKWLPGEPVQFYLDGTLVFTANATDDLKQNCPDAAQLISLRAGAYYSAYWGGIPDATTQWPGVAEYDWVRVWHAKPMAIGDGAPSPPED